MKYWIVYYDGTSYKLKHDVSFNESIPEIAMFRCFDMAYDYVTKLNGSQHLGQTYSRWTVKR
jgi:hypothetical protein